MPENSIKERALLQELQNDNPTNKVWDDQATIDEKVGVIAQNIHRVSNILSSSPSQLTEQAKSYALGKVNSVISTETQKWLSRFGSANINLSIDRKGKLDNSALDLLLPLYDNKADWLFFSQLGYRHHDSRDTLNIGLGGRYFTPGWMYGLNTFFDNDFTGQHQRLGVGSEVWTNYVKFSANTYWRLSKWRESPKELDYEERPADGYDINGEFFLPVYPNLGGKLSYEQYFGDNVALFNRETKQKNPSLARFGLNYTPVPLMTMGVDYKLGNSGDSETLFLANLNYRFGIPFADQISPASVASMRTLVGSRYDIVERNNNIVLDYKKKPKFNLALPSTLAGYSTQHIPIIPNITAENKLKKLSWQANEAFHKNGGSVIPRGKSAEIDLPRYSAKGINSYTLSAIAEITDSDKPITTHMNVVVEPFAIKNPSIIPSSDPMIPNGKSAYDLAATVTYGNKNNPFIIQNRVIPNVKWSIDPPDEQAKLNWDPSGKTDDKGQLTATLSSTNPLEPRTKIHLSLDEQPNLEIKGNTAPSFAVKAKNFVFDQQGPYEATENKPIIVTATVFDLDGNTLNKKMDMNLQWTTEPADLQGLSVKPAPGYESSTDEDGKIKAIVTNTQMVKGAKAGVLINGTYQTFSEPFDFIAPESLNLAFDTITQSPLEPITADGKARYTYKIRVLDPESKRPLSHQTLSKLKAELLNTQRIIVPAEVKLEIPTNPTTDAEGYLTFYMTSQVGMDDIYFNVYPDASGENSANGQKSMPVSFNPIPKPVGILMQVPDSPSPKYIPEPERPYNVHEALIIQLTNDGKTNLHVDSDQTGRIRTSNITSSDLDLVEVDQTTGDIKFLKKDFSAKKWPVTVTLTKRDSHTGITSGYYYTFKPKKYILFPDNSRINPLGLRSENILCSNEPLPQYKYTYRPWADIGSQLPVAATVFDLGAYPQVTTSSSLSYEYDEKHFPYLGLKSLIDKLPKEVAGVSLLHTYFPGGRPGDYTTFYGYNYINRTVVPEGNNNNSLKTIPICVIRVDGYGETVPR
ncbi:inverse autotransporter beta domain-containing protein [Xenorhabdus sp. IM139775]|uniref:inverse autotransporter beta domain-containing protein n=1 Tax=Xenorhabdus sp. IM139775 TaxID=3025876 RepID=UPI0023585039|nr:inverse autotransporter beta domain-containing protein [Xenorhabdus sp. IM139775]MDC9594330.1 inverse autotransporter beta domain-containing protein [Xenorhabdus sp. IM139775]